MPQILLRGLTRALVTAVRDYARTRSLSTPDAATELVQRGLDHVRQQAAREAGAARTNATTPEQRAERARRASLARWARVRGEAP